MTYYRVKPEYDNCNIYKRIGHTNYCKITRTLIGYELLTKKEFSKLKVSPKYFDTVYIPKNDTYWFFGARFANFGTYAGD